MPVIVVIVNYQNPAHAGMNPLPSRPSLLMLPKPRSRGDEPFSVGMESLRIFKTPLTRG